MNGYHQQKYHHRMVLLLYLSSPQLDIVLDCKFVYTNRLEFLEMDIYTKFPGYSYFRQFLQMQ